MSRYSIDDRRTDIQRFEDAVVLLFAVLGTILTRFAREVKSIFSPGRED